VWKYAVIYIIIVITIAVMAKVTGKFPFNDIHALKIEYAHTMKLQMGIIPPFSYNKSEFESQGNPTTFLSGNAT
jgi:hypothetical protein